MPAPKKSDKVLVELGRKKKPKAINQKALKAASEVVQLAMPLPLPKVRGAAKVVKAAAKKVRKPTPPGVARHYATQVRAILEETNPANKKRMTRNIKPFTPTIPKLNKTRKKKKGS